MNFWSDNLIWPRMERPKLLVILIGVGAVLTSALPQDSHGLAHLNAFVSAASAEPLITSASETRFRFGNNNHGSTSERRLFIPGLDRRERQPTGRLSGTFSGIGAPPKTTKTPTTTPSSKLKPTIPSHENKFSDDYYYLGDGDEYYYDYYYDYYDDNTTVGQLGPLGALDPPSFPSSHSTTGKAQTTTTSRPFRFDFNNKLKERPSLLPSRTSPFPSRTASKTQSTRPSLADLLIKRIQNAEESQPSTPVNNDLTGQNREPRVIEESHTEKEEMQVHVTTNTESSRVVSSIKSSHSITSEDPSLTTPTQSFVDETTVAPSSISEVTDPKITALPETTSKRSLADIFETVDSESFLTGNVNSAEQSFRSLDDTQVNINVDILATEKKTEALKTSTTTTTTAATPAIRPLPTKATPAITPLPTKFLADSVDIRESLRHSSGLLKHLLAKHAETITESTPTTTEKITTTSKAIAAETIEKSDETIFDLFPAIQPSDISSFLPPGYKPVEEQPQESTTKAKIELIDDISALLPPGYKAPEEEPAKPLLKTVDVSAFLPPGYKPPANAKAPVVETLDVSAFLPPDYKPNGSNVESSTKKVEIEIVDMSSFLPPGYKPQGFEPEKPQGPPIVKTADVSAFLPPGYKVTEGEETVSSSTEATTTTKQGPNGIKFPKRPSRPRPATTTTSERPTPSGPPSVKPTIRNIFANRAVTKPFTGWPSTTPLPPKFVAESVDIHELLSNHLNLNKTEATTTPTTTTTTTTTTTSRPTTPGVCGIKCRLFGVIRITNGTQWIPELENRDTVEWQQLANSIEIELDQLYRSSPLAPWYEGVEIDGFHQGSVLVDYFLQLNEIKDNVATTDLKEILNRATASGEGHTLGSLTLDSRATDFLVMVEKKAEIVVDDSDYLIPQWLIAVIVIGLASLLFILIFGITVLVNRSRVKKRQSVPLTEEMLNELNKAHMSGFSHGHHNMGGGMDNYGMDAGLYDMDGVWNDKRMDRRMMKPPSSHGKGYNPNYNINIYDSWRTDWSGPYGSSATYAKRPRTSNAF